MEVSQQDLYILLDKASPAISVKPEHKSHNMFKDGPATVAPGCGSVQNVAALAVAGSGCKVASSFKALRLCERDF